MKRGKDKNKKKIIGAAAGAAAAAAAAGIAAATMKGRKPTVYHVRPGDHGWTLEKEGASDPESSHRIKRQAVKNGRRLASENRPARLVIHRKDATVQREHEYEPE